MSRVRLLAGISSAFVVLSSATGSTWYVDSSVPVSIDGKSMETAFKTIQEGIDSASNGEAVVVAQGIYVENIHFGGKNIILRSTNPLDPVVVASTIIDGNQSGSVVTFSGREGETCVLAGFTIWNGWAAEGGGIWGGTKDEDERDCTHATIRNNVIAGNSADDGGGLAYCDGVIENNIISGNSSEDDRGGGLYECDGTIRDNTIACNTTSAGDGDGGGLCRCDGTIESNTISENSAGCGGGLQKCHGLIQNNVISGNKADRSGEDGGAGGGLKTCCGTIRNNIITGNWAEEYGGGLADSYGTIENNVIAGNLSDEEGAGLSRCDGIIQNNVIVGNSAKFCGGGLHNCDLATIQNNTITGNSAATGGGLAYCDSVVRNCIIWGNPTTDGSQFHESTAPTYSCIQDWTGGGEGNIAEHPRFLDPDGPDDDPETYEDNDYRLSGNSPCIDAGNNSPDLPQTDILGNPRIMFGGKSPTVDMGAYEYYINQIKLNGQSEVVLTWSSRPGKTYSIHCSHDMVTWYLLADDIPSSGDTVTTWAEPTAPILSPGARRRYYKVKENQ